jgi:type IV pilus assembly protein PilA
MWGKLRKYDEDDGFTLIELLVVIIIIGILAAVAIPVFLKQREKAFDAAAKSDMYTLAQFEETYLAGFATSYGDIPDLIADGSPVIASKHVTLTVVRFDTSLGYCLSAKNSQSTNTWYWDSRAGGLQPKGSAGCPLTTTGTAGTSLSNP